MNGLHTSGDYYGGVLQICARNMQQSHLEHQIAHHTYYEIQLRFEKPLPSITLDLRNSSKEEIILVSSFLDMISWLYFVISFPSHVISKLCPKLPRCCRSRNKKKSNHEDESYCFIRALLRGGQL